MPYKIDRKNFIQKSAMAGMALMLTDQLKAFSPVKKEKVQHWYHWCRISLAGTHG